MAEPDVFQPADLAWACAAAGAVTDLDAVAHLSFGDYSVRPYFWQINQFRAVRAYDIARVIGVDPDLPDELVQGIWEELSRHAEEWRTIGVCSPPPSRSPTMHHCSSAYSV